MHFSIIDPYQYRPANTRDGAWKTSVYAYFLIADTLRLGMKVNIRAGLAKAGVFRFIVDVLMLFMYDRYT